MSGISGDRARRIQKALQEKLDNIFNTAIVLHPTVEEMREAAKEHVWSSVELARAPSYVASYLEGYAQARWNEISRYHLVWTIWVDGELMTHTMVESLTELEKKRGYATINGEEIPLDSPLYQSPWKRIDSNKSRHVWLDKQGRPLTDKPY